MPVPNSQQVIDALASKNVALECRTCQNATSIKLDVAGLALTQLGTASVNTSTSSLRYTPVALLTCGNCGDTRMFHLQWLGFPPPY